MPAHMSRRPSNVLGTGQGARTGLGPRMWRPAFNDPKKAFLLSRLGSPPPYPSRLVRRPRFSSCPRVSIFSVHTSLGKAEAGLGRNRAAEGAEMSRRSFGAEIRGRGRACERRAAFGHAPLAIWPGQCDVPQISLSLVAMVSRDEERHGHFWREWKQCADVALAGFRYGSFCSFAVRGSFLPYEVEMRQYLGSRSAPWRLPSRGRERLSGPWLLCLPCSYRIQIKSHHPRPMINPAAPRVSIINNINKHSCPTRIHISTLRGFHASPHVAAPLQLLLIFSASCPSPD